MKLLIITVVLMGCTSVAAQTPILQSGTANHAHYLFNVSYQFDQPDTGGVPWNFYYGNVATQPPSGSRRSASSGCYLSEINAAPYGNTESGAPEFEWFTYPSLSAADGQLPYASPGEFFESAPISGSVGFDFEGEFAGYTTSPTSPSSGSYFTEYAYFSDRPCFDAGTEYSWYRDAADYYSGDQPVDSVTFYYSTFTNCNIDFACYDTNGQIVEQNTATVVLTGIPLNSQSTRAYKFIATRSGSSFTIQLIDPSTGQSPTSACGANTIFTTQQWQYTGPGSGYYVTNQSTLSPVGNCSFNVPIASWFPAASVTQNGYITIGTQSSRVYPPPTGSSRGSGGPPPNNLSGSAQLTAANVFVYY